MRYFIAGLVALVLVACSGNDKGDRVLHFTGRDETEANFRQRTRQLLRLFEVKTRVCLPLVGKSPEAALRLLRTEGQEDDGDIPVGATPKPGQKADEKDLVRSAEIVLEECQR